jgi:hypothetical protein
MIINMIIGNFMTINYDYTINSHVEYSDVVSQTVKNLNKYENVIKFSTNWPTFNLGLVLV